MKTVGSFDHCLGQDMAKAYQSYVVWNNKGGTGKTTITFHLSTEYAVNYPDKDIIVIDTCPQGNISATLLSGLDEEMKGETGDKVLQKIISEEITTKYFKKSVCGYLEKRLARGLGNKIPYKSFLVQPCMHNKYITNNIYLLCGDPYLEVIAKRLEQDRGLIETRSEEVPWKRVTLFIKEFIEEVSQKTKNECIFFIDTNSSFSVYTEMAIVGATRIIVPINADDFCKKAVISMLYFLHGNAIEIQDEKNTISTEMMFSNLARKNKIEIPKIHLIINNRITTYEGESANAFDAKYREVLDLLANILENYPDIFVSRTMDEHKCELNDFHTMAVQCLQLGCRLSELPNQVMMNGNEYVYNAGPSSTKDKYLDKLKLIINRL